MTRLPDARTDTGLYISARDCESPRSDAPRAPPIPGDGGAVEELHRLLRGRELREGDGRLAGAHVHGLDLSEGPQSSGAPRVSRAADIVFSVTSQ